MKDDKSRELFDLARQVMPGGVNSPVRAYKAVGMTPRFIARANGSKIYDVDGNEYIDFVGSWGPMILGHARPEVVSAVCEAAGRGTSYGAPTQGEITLAKMIINAVPCAQMVRLVNSGTEAVMSAVRAARGYTGRELIVKFEGCYHGHSDGLLVKAGSGLLTENVPTSAGVPGVFAATTLTANYNDEESVKEIFEKYGSDIAALIVEPVAANMGVVPPKPGFLAFLREITERYGSVLIFDEVITGFRLSLGGAQEYYRVTPDMATLGKIIGGGMPLAAYCGKKEIMSMVSPSGPVYQAGTLSGNPAAVAAGIATLKLLFEKPDIYKELDEKGAFLEKACKEAIDRHKIRACVNRAGSLLSVFFTDGPVESYKDVILSDTGRFAKAFSILLDSGIYVAPSQFEAVFISLAHSGEDLARTAEAIDRAFGALGQ